MNCWWNESGPTPLAPSGLFRSQPGLFFSEAMGKVEMPIAGLAFDFFLAQGCTGRWGFEDVFFLTSWCEFLENEFVMQRWVFRLGRLDCHLNVHRAPGGYAFVFVLPRCLAIVLHTVLPRRSQSSAPNSPTAAPAGNHTYLRISITERCNLRCQYCMPARRLSRGHRGGVRARVEVQQGRGVFDPPQRSDFGVGSAMGSRWHS